MRALGYTRGVGTLCFTMVLWYACSGVHQGCGHIMFHHCSVVCIDKQYRYEKKPFVFTNSEHKCRVPKKLVAKIKFDREIYPDLFTYVLLRRTFRLCGQSFD